MFTKIKMYLVSMVILLFGITSTLFAREVLDVKREIIVKFDDTVIVMPPEISSSDREAIALRAGPAGTWITPLFAY